MFLNTLIQMTNKKATISLEFPNSLLKNLEEVQKHLAGDLQPGERVPSIEELIIDAIAESYGEEEGRVL